MTLNPKAIATARRNLAQRIERFLKVETRGATEPDGWQCQNVEFALRCLEMDDHATGERAMLAAERSMRTGSVEPVTRSSKELLARLNAITQCD